MATKVELARDALTRLKALGPDDETATARHALGEVLEAIVSALEGEEDAGGTEVVEADIDRTGRLDDTAVA